MILSDATFWATFTDWHVRTEHRWDFRLHMEAMTLNIEGFGRTLSEALNPALERAAAAIRQFVEASR